MGNKDVNDKDFHGMKENIVTSGCTQTIVSLVWVENDTTHNGSTFELNSEIVSLKLAYLCRDSNLISSHCFDLLTIF